MRVLDASVLTDAVASAGSAGDVARRLVAAEDWLHVPAIATAEVISALRSMLRRGALDEVSAREAAAAAMDLRTRAYPFEPFVGRVWALRDNVTVYDAWYVALAETLGAVLVTADDRLARASGPMCPVVTAAAAVREH